MSAAGATDGLLGIGSVLALLRPDFPDVTISKIRFLETEGLVEPERTASGYRKFAPADLNRLRYVLACQRDHYLPLKVIREHLEAIDRGLEPANASSGTGGRVPRSLASVDSLPSSDSFRAKAADVRLSRPELVAEAGITEAVLDQLESFAIVAPLPYGGPVRHYDAAALEIARTVAGMAAFGIEPRHLRQFKVAADREVGLVEQVVTPMLRQRDPQSRQRADDAIRELASLSVRLHRSLVTAGLGRELGR
ncbi:MAG TPA: MerR family transcriptional regulator [Candidatus Nanopelagicales bacterium]